jgi:hypothetical protein
LSENARDIITNVLEDEINLLHLAEKKSSNIAREEDDDEDEEMPDVGDLSPETRGAIHEKRICDLAARIVLAVLGGSLPKSFAQTLQRHKGKVGPSYDKIVIELGVEKPVVKKAAPVTAAAEEIIEDAPEDAPEDVPEDAVMEEAVEEAIEVRSDMDDE